MLGQQLVKGEALRVCTALLMGASIAKIKLLNLITNNLRQVNGGGLAAHSTV